jgi:hypothetical protein
MSSADKGRVESSAASRPQIEAQAAHSHNVAKGSSRAVNLLSGKRLNGIAGIIPGLIGGCYREGESLNGPAPHAVMLAGRGAPWSCTGSWGAQHTLVRLCLSRFISASFASQASTSRNTRAALSSCGSASL